MTNDTKQNEIDILLFNVHSLLDLSRRFVFANSTLIQNYHIICLTETWLTEHIPTEALFLSNYSVFRNDRTSEDGKSKHGGVLIAVHKSIKSKEILVNNPGDDYVIVQLTSQSKKFLIACIYNPPQNSPYNWSASKVQEFFSVLLAKKKSYKCQFVIITGDINLPNTKWSNMESSCDYENEWLQAMQSHNFEQTLRFEDQIGNAKQLDVFLIDDPQYWISSAIDFNTFQNYSLNEKRCSDHLAYSNKIFHDVQVDAKKQKTTYAYNRTDWEKFNESIVKQPFLPYCFSNIDELLDQWYNWFENLFNENVPKVTAHRSNLPTWVSPASSNLMKKLANTKKLAIETENPKTIDKVILLEQELERSVTSDQRSFEEDVFKARQFSGIQKYLRKLKQAPPFPYEMYLAEERATSDLEKAELFNKFFQSVFNPKPSNDLSADLPTAAGHRLHVTDHHYTLVPEQSLNDFLVSPVHDSVAGDRLQTSELEIPITLSKIECSERQIENILLNLQVNKAKGPDGIGNLTLRNLAKTISKSLHTVFKTCLNKGKFPTKWKTGLIVPLHKDGDKAAITCYRPINCLCCPSKVLEKIIFDCLYNAIRKYLHDSQFGFRPLRSCVVQMLCFLDKIYRDNDNKLLEELIVFYLDFEKAFDKVPHDRIIAKLRLLGIHGRALAIIADYLDNRKQKVKVGDSISSERDVTSGVPQGSLLGPLLFLIYINDLPENIDNSTCFGYADDYKLIAHNTTELEQDLQALHNWCCANGMSLHENKCSILNFKRMSTVRMNEKIVSTSNTQKDLGIIINDNLTWHDNTMRRHSKALRALWSLRRNLPWSTSRRSKLNAYVGYVVPIMMFACQVGYPNKSDLKLIEKLQKDATKWILWTERDYKDRLIQLKLLPLSLYAELQCLLLFCSILDGSYDIDHTNYINVNSNHRTRQGTNHDILVNKNRLRKTDENFWHRSAILYNIVSKSVNLLEPTGRKRRITKVYRNFFLGQYSETNSCTWRILCYCRNCNPQQKLNVQ